MSVSSKIKKLFFTNIKHIIVLMMVMHCSHKLQAQVRSATDTIITYAWVSPEGDTLSLAYLPTLQVLSIRHLTPAQRAQKAAWNRLRNAVFVTYPYAKAAGRIINEINLKLAGVTDKHQRKAIIKSREKELRKEFTTKITDLSVYQGKVLMKLINRETGNNCYEIISEYKGGFTAAVYQGVAFVFGSSLKQAYNPNSEDKAIEYFAQEVEKMYGYR